MKKILIVGMIALGSFAGYAAKTYTVTADGGTRTEPVSLDLQDVVIYDSETQISETKPISSVTFEPGSTFFKRGSGFVLSSSKLGTFSGGEIRIEEGALVVSAAGQLGDNTSKETAPVVYVKDGASFVIATTTAMATSAGAADAFKNVFHIAGSGPNGESGAFVLQSTATPNYIFDADICLDADAVMTSFTSQRYLLGAGMSLRLNGYKLSLKRNESSWTLGMFGADVRDVGEAGSIVINTGTTLMLQTGSTACWEGDSQNELVIENGGTLQTYTSQQTIPWTMRVKKTAYYDLSCGAAPEWGATNQNFYSGPVVVDAGAALYVKRHWDQYHDCINAVFYGAISGEGTIVVQDVWMHLMNGGNTITGDITVTKSSSYEAGVAVWRNGAFTKEGSGVIRLNDAQLRIVDKTTEWISHGSYCTANRINGTEYLDMPSLVCTVSEGASSVFSGATNGTVQAIVKQGAGALTLDANVRVLSCLDVQSGTVKVGRFAGAGMLGSRVFASNSDNSKNAETLGQNANLNWIVASASYFTTTAYKSHALYRAELGFDMANEIGHEFFVAPPDGKAYWDSNAFYYEGYIWNRSAETQTWTFAGGCGSNLHLFIDGVKVASFTDYQLGMLYTFDIAPGAHKIEMRGKAELYVSPNAYVPVGYQFCKAGGPTQWCLNNYTRLGGGFRLDKQGRGLLSYADYDVLTDSGDGALLTQTQDGTPLVNAGIEFGNVQIAKGAVLDVNGNSYVLDTLGGVGTIANGNAYFDAMQTVTNELHVVAAEIAAGEKLTVNGKLAFGPDAKVAIDDFKSLPRSTPEQPITIATATDGIEGLPSLKDNPDGRWCVATSDDGKSLVLWRTQQGLILIFR